jgi:hypothetical protein
VEVIIGTPIFGCLVLPFVVALVLRNERLTGGWTALEEIDEGTEVTLNRLCEKLNELECTAPLELLLFEY